MNPHFQKNGVLILKKSLIASAAAVALCAPALCSAVTVSGGSKTGLGIIAVNPSAGNPLTQNAVDAALWNPVSAARSPSQAKPFEALSTGLVTTSTPLLFTTSTEPSPVPLPGVVWLFVLGVLGMAGSRMTTPRGVGQDTQRPQQAHPAPRSLAGALLNA